MGTVSYQLLRKIRGLGNAEHWYERGREHEEKDRSLKAIRAYQRALVMDPHFHEALINLGRLLHQAKNLKAARIYYNRARQTDPADPIPYFNLGVLCEDEGCSRLATVRAYRAALRRDKNFADVHHNLALLYERYGRCLDAQYHERRYARITGRAVG